MNDRHQSSHVYADVIARSERNPPKRVASRKPKPLSERALDETAKALAHRGADYGWNPYYKGNRIAAATLRAMAKQDDAVVHWYEAFRAALAAYKAATGRDWSY